MGDPSPDVPEAGGGRTILVVDDDAAVLRVIERALTQNGYRVITAETAHSGREALGGEVPDMVIMDVVLPGMDGREASNLFLSRNPDLPVLFISGHARQNFVKVGPLAPRHSFLSKPFDVKDLLAAVVRALD